MRDKSKGWVNSRSTLKAKRKDIVDECLDPQMCYDDWKDPRDGFRAYAIDKTKKFQKTSITKKIQWQTRSKNELRKIYHKVMKHIRIRRRRKEHPRNKE